MRPTGEVRQALFDACRELATPGRGPTLREIAVHACVGVKAATSTVKRMRRAGQLRIARVRRVDYRNKPVAEYVPVAPVIGQDAGFVDLSSALRAWGG